MVIYSDWFSESIDLGACIQVCSKKQKKQGKKCFVIF